MGGTGAGRLGSAFDVPVTTLRGGKSLRGAAGRGGTGGGVVADLKGGTIFGGVEEVGDGVTLATGGSVGLGASTLTTGGGGGVTTGATGSTTALGFSSSTFLGILLRTNSNKSSRQGFGRLLDGLGFLPFR